MGKVLNLSGKLDFSEIDLTAPEKVVREILVQLPENTQNIISGDIIAYDGHVTSYTTSRPSIAEVLGGVSRERRIDIQDSLGELGVVDKKFECFLYTSDYAKYKYRLFFMRYGIANYPVQFTLEESIARSIQGINSNYIVTCNNRDDVEDLVFQILTSQKVLAVMQELIRISQAKRNGEITEEVGGSIDTQ